MAATHPPIDLVEQDRRLLRLDVEDFFSMEAALLDDRRYDEWLDLLADETASVAVRKGPRRDWTNQAPPPAASK